MVARSTFALVAACAAALVVSCGARSGLHDAPYGAGLGADGGDGGGGAGGERDAEMEAGVRCLPGSFTLERGVAKVVLVVDRSGSMMLSLSSNEEPVNGEPTRWDALRSAVAQTITPFDGEIALGATFFPNVASATEQANGCSVAESETIAPGLGHGAAVLDALGRGAPFGGTPTAVAVRASADLLAQARGTVRALVLATDGAPNCNQRLDPRACTCTSTGDIGNCGNAGHGEMCLDDRRAITTIEEVVAKDKIPVFVLGIGDQPGSIFSTTLDAMAVAGGRPRSTSPRFHPARSPSELASALTTIRDGVARCTYLTPSAPGEDANGLERGEIEVSVAGLTIARDPSRTDGWDWVDRAYGQLALFGRACEAASTGTSSGPVTALVRCGP